MGFGKLKGFISKTYEDATSAADTGVGAMRDAIKTSFSTDRAALTAAENAPKASRVFASSLISGVRQEAATPGTPGNRFMNTPLLGLGGLIPGGNTRVGRKIESEIMPTPKHLTSDVTEVASHPSLGSGAAAANDAFKIGTAPLIAAEGVRGMRGLASLPGRAGGLASEAGAVGDISKLPAAYRAGLKISSKAAGDVAGETSGRAAARAAKQLVDSETGLVMTKLDKTTSGFIPDAVQAPVASAVRAENTTNAAARSAADAAKTTAKDAVSEAPSAPGRVGRFTSYVRGKVAGAGKTVLTSPVRAVKEAGASAGEAVQAVTHPGLRSTPFHLIKAGLKAGEAVANAVPAAAVTTGALAVAQDLRRPSAAQAKQDSEDETLAKNMNMSVGDYRGIKAVYEKYHDQGLQALERGLAKARKTPGYSDEAVNQKLSQGAKSAASKKKARDILRSSVASYLE